MRKSIHSLIARLTLLMMMGAFVWVRPALATSAPSIVNYQGRLLNANGVPSSAATASVLFRFTDSTGATCYWTDSSSTCASSTARTVSLTDGLFSEPLGDTSGTTPNGAYAGILATVFANHIAVYLEVTVNGEILTPRKQILSSPFALNANQLTGLDPTTSGDTASAIVALDANGALQVTGNPAGSGVSQGAVYVNPAAADVAAGDTILGVAVGGTQKFRVDSNGLASLTRATSGEFLGMTDGTDTFGIYNYPGNPTGNVTANTGSLVTDTTNGALYVKTSDASNTGWSLVGTATNQFVQNGNAFGAAAVLGTTDANTLSIIADNVTALTVDTSGNTQIAAGRNFTTGAGAGNFDWSASTGTFATSTGTNTLNGNVVVSGANTFTSGTGAIALNGDVTIAGAKTFTVGTGASTLGGSLAVTGTSTLTGAQTLVGNTDLQGTLADSTGNVTIGDNVDMTGTLALTGAATISSTLGVTGDQTNTGNFTQTGATTFSTGTGAVSLNGDVTLAANKNFLQNGTGTFATASGSNTLGGNVTLNGTTVTGAGASLTMTSAAGTAMTVNAGTTGTLTLDSGSTGNVNLGTGATAKTITIGNTTGVTTLALSAGTGGIITTGDIIPSADNTDSLGSTTSRYKTIHIGPGSLVLHNDATNTDKATLQYTAGVAELVTSNNDSLNVTAGGTGTLTVDTGSTGALNFGTGASAKTVTIGNTTGASALVFNAGTGGATINGSTSISGANTLTIGTGTATFGGSVTQSGTGNFDASGTTGMFATSTGINTLNGNTTIAGAKTFTTGTGVSTINSTSIVLAGNSTVLDQTGTGTLSLNTATNRAITTGTGLFTAGGSLAVTGTSTLTALTTTGVTMIGNGSATVSIISSDWNIDAGGNMSNIGNLTMDGNFSQTGTTTFSTGDGLISLNGDTTIAGTKTFTTGTGTSTIKSASVVLSGNSTVLDMTGTGTLSLNTATNRAITTGSGLFTTGGAATVTGAATLLSTLDVSGNTTLTGDIAVNGGDITSTSTTFNLINTTATTLNIGGAATTIGLGAAGATVTGGGSLIIKSAATTALTMSSGTTGSLFLDSGSTGTVNLAVNNSAKTVNIATGTGGDTINFGTGAATNSIVIGNSTGATSVVVNGGTGAMNWGVNAVAHSIGIGNNTGNTSVTLTTGTGGFNISSGTGAVNISDDASATSVNVGTGAAVKTVIVGSQTGVSITTIKAGTGGVFLDGDVGIGVNPPTAQLHTNGTVRFAAFGAGTLTTDASGNVTVSSDERLKDISGYYTTGLSALRGIMPIAYKWNATSGLEREHTYYGFSAQNLQANLPESVMTGPSGYLSLLDRPILAALVNGEKELDTRVLALEDMSAILRGLDIDSLGNISTTGEVVEKIATSTGGTVDTFAITTPQHRVQLSGSVTLEGGLATVHFADIDQHFTSIINPNVQYTVFTTPDGATGQLYVTDRTVDGFVVHDPNGASGVSVDWLVVAQRIDDHTSENAVTSPASQNTDAPVTVDAVASPSPAATEGATVDQPAATTEVSDTADAQQVTTTDQTIETVVPDQVTTEEQAPVTEPVDAGVAVDGL